MIGIPGFGMSMQMGMGGDILSRSIGMAGGMSMGAVMNIGGLSMNMGMGMEIGSGFGCDCGTLSLEALMGGQSNFMHPLLSGGIGTPQIGSMNGMGMVPGMMYIPNQMQNQQMMLMLMQLLMMLMQLMQQMGAGNGMMGGSGYGMPGCGMPSYGMPGYGMPSYGMPGYGMPGGYGSPIGMSPTFGGGTGNTMSGITGNSTSVADPNTQIPNYGRNASREQIGQMLDAAARKYGIPPDILKAVAWQESGWRANASSFDGGHGKGIMQIDDRFHQFARTSDVWDPAKNIEYGARYLSNLYKQTGSWEAALKRYNGGSSYPPKVLSLAQSKPWLR